MPVAPKAPRSRPIRFRKPDDPVASAAEERNAYLDALIENSPLAIVVLDSTHRIRLCNPEFGRLFQYQQEEVVGRDIDDLIAPAGDEAEGEVRAITAEVLASRSVHTTTMRRRKDGTLVPVELYGVPLNISGRLAGVYAIYQDITERRRAEDATRQSLSILKSTLESTTDGILVVDCDGRIVASNSRFAEMWRIPEEVVRRGEDGPLLELVREQLTDADGFLERVRQLYDRPDDLGFDVLEFKDGRFFERYSAPHRIDGRSVGRVWSFRDVTDRHRSQEALRVSEERYRLLVERNLAGVFVSTLDGRFLECNDAFARILGYDSRADLLGHHALEVYFSPADRDSFLAHLLPAGSVVNFEFRCRRKDGSPVWLLENVHLVPGERGRPALLEGTVVDVTDRKLADEKVQYHAYHDALTGLPNRLLFMDRLTLALARCRREKSGLAVLFLDLDQFKLVNDTLGHSMGDRLLQDVAARLRGCVREEDTIARIGGDEFILLLPEIGSSGDAGRVVQKILDAFVVSFPIEGRLLHVTASVGVSLYPGDGEEPETLLGHADTAMYRAKDFGRNGYQLFTPAMNARVSQRLIVESGVRDALVDERLAVTYRPILSVSDGLWRGASMWLRWTPAGRAPVEGEELLSLAEETRLAAALGRWALSEGFRRAASWGDRLAPGRLSIPVPRSLLRHRFGDAIRTALRERGTAPALVELVLPGSARLDDLLAAVDATEEPRAGGLTLSLSGFGTDRAPLQALVRLPLRAIRIEAPSSAAGEQCGQRAIRGALVAMAHGLGLAAVAVGVGHDGAESLAEAGFDEVEQVESLEAAEIERLLSAR